MSTIDRSSIEVFSTCPQSKDGERSDYSARVEVARWSEEAGFHGILVYTDNGLVDPWLRRAGHPPEHRAAVPARRRAAVYMHPYTAAKMVATLAFLHGRRIYLNMVAGGFKNDLLALDDETPHDDRYDRLVEYTTIIKALLVERRAGDVRGRLLQGHEPEADAAVPPELFPGILVSGSSDAGLAAARALGATAVKYPKPPGRGGRRDPGDDRLRRPHGHHRARRPPTRPGASRSSASPRIARARSRTSSR